MRLRPAVAAVFTIVCLARYASAESCAVDQDCPIGSLCFGGGCIEIKGSQSLLRIKVIRPSSGVEIYLDGKLMGEAPWEGLIAPGIHEITIRANGYQTRIFKGTSKPADVEEIRIELEREKEPKARTPKGAKAETEKDVSLKKPLDESGDEERKVPGRFGTALMIGSGFGRAYYSQTKKDKVKTLQIGGAVTARLVEDPAWMEIGITASYCWLDIEHIASWGDYERLDIGALFRVLSAISDNFFYWGGELDIGFAVSFESYFYAALRGGIALMVREMLEIRVNFVGVQLVQELRRKDSILGFSCTMGIAVRFL